MHSFIKKDGVQLRFVFMSRRKKKHYVVVIRNLPELMPSTSLCEIVLNFEGTLLSAERACTLYSRGVPAEQKEIVIIK